MLLANASTKWDAAQMLKRAKALQPQGDAVPNVLADIFRGLLDRAPDPSGAAARRRTLDQAGAEITLSWTNSAAMDSK